MAGKAIPDESVEISIVVPVYRSAETLGELYRRLRAVLDYDGLRQRLGADAAANVIRCHGLAAAGATLGHALAVARAGR